MIKIIFLKIAFLTLLFSFSFLLITQTPTVGLIYSNEEATEGYMLFTPGNNNSVFQ